MTDFEIIFEALERAHVKYVVVGGVAELETVLKIKAEEEK